MAIGALQGRTVSVPLSVSVSSDSDTGISNSDGITKVRSPQVTGVAMPGATVILFANDAVVGSTIVGTTGNWEIVSQELSDGAYDLKV
jgi:Bacterial Ig-like domain